MKLTKFFFISFQAKRESAFGPTEGFKREERIASNLIFQPSDCYLCTAAAFTASHSIYNFVLSLLVNLKFVAGCDYEFIV